MVKTTEIRIWRGILLLETRPLPLHIVCVCARMCLWGSGPEASLKAAAKYLFKVCVSVREGAL